MTEGAFSMQRVLSWLGVVTACGMFLVLVMGARVTNTGSAMGCGGQWPLCHGKFIPDLAGATFIEFSHRAVTAAETVLVFAFGAGMLLLYRRRREAQVLVPLMIAFLLLQAIMGGLAVVYPESPPILALHFGISLISFASVVLAAIFVLDLRAADAVRDRPVPRGLGRWVWGALIFTYVVVYMGAYVRHDNAMGACGMHWPTCNGSLIPSLTGLAGVNFAHRLASGLLLLVVVALWWQTWRSRASRPDLLRGATAALLAVLLQSASGAQVVLTGFGLYSLLAHAALVALLFASLCYLAYQLVPRRICLPRDLQAAAASPATVGAPTR
jgi:cytochrome c oxidase assembly protein subunit 15